MAFWTDSKTKEPLRQNRWYITLGSDLDQFVYALKECKKPEYEIGVTEHKLLTHVFRYPTLLKWKPVTIKYVSAIGGTYFIKDPYGSTAAAAVLAKNPQAYAAAAAAKERKHKENIRLAEEASNNHLANTLEGISYTSGYRLPSANTQQIISKADSQNSLGVSLDLTQIDQNGMIIERWKLQNPFISGVDYGSLTYENENFVDISVTIQYDWAERDAGNRFPPETRPTP